MNDYIILVDDRDNVIGYSEKMEVHKQKLCHRAFSIFIFDWNTKKILLQKRAYGKYHSGGLWTNACCSHPRKDESMEVCLNERIKEELGLTTEFYIENPAKCGVLLHGKDVIYWCGKFSYYSSYGDVCENEIDHVFLYSPFGGGIDWNTIFFNKQEVAEIRWVTIEELKKWIEKNPEEFTTWFQPAFKVAYGVLCTQARHMDLFLGNHV